MSARFVIRKNSGDPEFPWAVRDRECEVVDNHNFTTDDGIDGCTGWCEATTTHDVATRVVLRAALK